MNEVKSFTPIDLPLLRRLASRGLSLDTIALIRDANPLETAMLGAVGLTGRGRPTYILRTEAGEYAAQMHFEDTRARISLLAPAPHPDGSQTPWLALIDHMLEQAGRRGAHMVAAEVPIEGVTLELYRHAGFTIYSRQSLYYLDRRQATSIKVKQDDQSKLFVRPLHEADYPRLKALYLNTVPRLVQHADFPPESGAGWNGLALIYEGVLRGYISVWEGKGGLLLQPYLHPELYDLDTDIFSLALDQLPKRRTYVRLLAYQVWLRQALTHDLGFVEWSRSALMARHTTIVVKTATFSPLAALEAMGLVGGPEVALERNLELPDAQLIATKNLSEWDTE